MAEFVLLFRSTPQAQQAAMGTPEAAQQSLQRWLAWVHGLEADGILKSRGQPLDREGRVVSAGTVTDGPYVETKDLVLGFNVIEARDLDHAARIAAGCPIAQGGGSVEVRPVMAMPV
ncbi:MAG TPA: YciI family protein [Longimicrobium sp.]|nr:YciI family protein [Longimicrobium sp.]